MTDKELKDLEIQRLMVGVLGICNGNVAEAERAWRWITGNGVPKTQKKKK